MINKHLTDTDIQQYVLDKTACDPQLVQHIAVCVDCKQKAEQYYLLFNAIREEEKPAFDFNLAGLVMKQLPQPQKAHLTGQYFVYAIASVLILLSGILPYLYRSYLQKLFKANAPLSTALIVTAIVSLSIFLFADMYRKYKKQMEALNFY
jgi:multisubunit Na+/H+ antiporter MnhC subunit